MLRPRTTSLQTANIDAQSSQKMKQALENDAREACKRLFPGITRGYTFGDRLQELVSVSRHRPVTRSKLPVCLNFGNVLVYADGYGMQVLQEEVVLPRLES